MLIIINNICIYSIQDQELKKEKPSGDTKLKKVILYIGT